MGFARRYFSVSADDPPPLTASVTRRVRFEEVDALNMVWHGRYPSYFEDGRIAFGDKYGLSYMQFRVKQIMAPIVQMHLDYHAPLHFDETILIETTLYWNEAIRLDYDYRLISQDKKLAARGYTVQLLTDIKGNLLLTLPDWLLEFRNRWRQGLLVP